MEKHTCILLTAVCLSSYMLSKLWSSSSRRSLITYNQQKYRWSTFPCPKKPSDCWPVTTRYMSLTFLPAVWRLTPPLAVRSFLMKVFLCHIFSSGPTYLRVKLICILNGRLCNMITGCHFRRGRATTGGYIRVEWVRGRCARTAAVGAVHTGHHIVRGGGERRATRR